MYILYERFDYKIHKLIVFFKVKFVCTLVYDDITVVLCIVSYVVLYGTVTSEDTTFFIPAVSCSLLL